MQDASLNAVWPVRPTRGVNRGYQTGMLRADGTLSEFTAAAAPTVYRGDRLPSDLYGNVFVAEPSGNLVSRIIINDDGTTLRGRKAYDQAEFIASTDERFRPVNLSSAPDGTLYVVDMYRGIIQHRGYITEYLRDQILSRKLEQPIGRGRIYRVVHESTRRDRQPALSTAPRPRLVETLSHPNGWWRDTAQRLLVERGDKSAVDALKKLAVSAPQAAHEAACALDARRPGRDRPRDGDDARSAMRRATCGVSALRLAGAVAARAPASDPRGGVQAVVGHGLGGAATVRRVARRAAQGP